MFRLLTVLFLALNCDPIQSRDYSTECIFFVTNSTRGYSTTSQNFVIDCTKKYSFFAHGYNGKHNDPFIFDEIDKLSNLPNATACYIDWTPFTSVAEVYYPLIDVPGIANEVAKSIFQPIYKKCGKTTWVYAIGHSLGAALVGQAGRQLTKMYKNVLNTCMALDAAGPYIPINKGGPINATDCELVITLHTDDYGLGSPFITGKANFVANYGTNQPGCASNETWCDHLISVRYFNESITNPCGFEAYSCTSFFGFYFPWINPNITYNLEIPKDASGTYCFDTNSQSPFAQGPANCSTTTVNPTVITTTALKQTTTKPTTTKPTTTKPTTTNPTTTKPTTTKPTTAPTPTTKSTTRKPTRKR